MFVDVMVMFVLAFTSAIRVLALPVLSRGTFALRVRYWFSMIGTCFTRLIGWLLAITFSRLVEDWTSMFLNMFFWLAMIRVMAVRASFGVMLK